MASTYPNTLDSFPTGHVDGVHEVIHASDINNLADAVNKIEAELGVLPKGGAASVRARLDAISLQTVLAVGASANNTVITNGGTPVNGTDLVTKNYVDIATYNNQSASYTLALTDLGKVINFTGSSAATLTIPLNSSVAFPLLSVIYVCQGGTGQVTIAGAGGVTLVNPFTSFTTAARYAELKLTKIATDSWRVNGEVT